MPYIYAADLWCDSCGAAIKADLDAAGRTPDGPDFDSDDYPKYVADTGESDGPYHCGAGSECLEPESTTYPDGSPIPCLLTEELTDEGVQYVRDSIQDDPDNPVTQLWAEHFDVEDNA